jgi:hypothetical protein
VLEQLALVVVPLIELVDLRGHLGEEFVGGEENGRNRFKNILPKKGDYLAIQREEEVDKYHFYTRTI